MISFIVRALFVYTISWLLWCLSRRLTAKSPLDNIPGPPSLSRWTGNFTQVFNVDAWNFHKTIAETYGGLLRVTGLFGETQLFVFDPKAMQHIVVKDQNIYEEVPEFMEEAALIFGKGLFATKGDHHRKQRKMLNPVFSVAHMREMVPIFYEVAHKTRAAFAAKVARGSQEVDILHWMSRTALELIGQSGLGHSFDPLTEGAEVNPYSRAIKDLVPTVFRMYLSRTYILPWAVKIGSPRFRKFLVDIVPWKNLHELRDIIEVFHKTSVGILEAKKKALQEGEEAVLSQIGHGKDLISILMKANMEASEEDRLPESEVLGQMSTLTFAATDTTSGALSRTLQLLARHPEAQEKLRQEVEDAKTDNGDLSYDDLVSLPYLDAVCRETLRLYPPLTLMQRTTIQDAVLPLSTPIKGVDGKEMHEILVPKDTRIIVSMLSANRHPAIWGPDSYEWKPERWLAPLPEAVIEARVPGIYSHLMTFMGGSRACIGFKFSQLEMKVVLATLVEKFRFSPSKRDQEVFWEMNALATPSLDGRPQLPLTISPL